MKSPSYKGDTAAAISWYRGAPFQVRRLLVVDFLRGRLEEARREIH